MTQLRRGVVGVIAAFVVVSLSFSAQAFFIRFGFAGVGHNAQTGAVFSFGQERSLYRVGR